MRHKPGIHFVPVYKIPECIDKLCPVILIVKIVRMLPDIDGHQDPVSWYHVDIVLLKLHDKEPPGIHAIREYCPTRSFGTSRSLGKLLFEPLEFPELCIYGFCKFVLRYSSATNTGRCQISKEQFMQPETPDMK